MGSIRTRTLALVLGLLATSLAAISWKSYDDARHEIEELFDAQLAQTARVLEGMVSGEMAPAARDSVQRALNAASNGRDESRPGHRYESKLAFQVLDARADVVLQSASAPAELFANLVEVSSQGGAAARSNNVLAGYHDVRLGDHLWRAFVLPDARDGLWIVVAERDDVRGELVGKISRRSVLPDVVGLPLLGLLVWVAIGWSLRPLKQIAASIKARSADNLAPLVLGRVPLELEPMVAALNRLLQQLHALLEHEKRFIADAAHELRTPLSVLRIHAQNALSAPDEDDRADALRRLIDGVDRATRLVAQLLTLARLEPSAAQLSAEPFDLNVFARDALAEIIPLALERDQTLTLLADDAGDYRIEADRTAIGVLLQNLVGNAIQYTPEGGEIVVALEPAADAVMLRIEDSGPGVAGDAKAKVLERFFRGDTGTGAGLGLSIVQRVVELHRGEITLGDAALGGLDVGVRLPRRYRA